MEHSIILSPSIYFHNNQSKLINILLKKSIASFSTEEADFEHFIQNDNPYTFIIVKSDVPFIVFIKGHYTNLKITPSDIFNVVFKNAVNMVDLSNSNDINTKNTHINNILKEKNEHYKPKYSDIANEIELHSYSNFDKKSFKDFTLLLNDDNGYGDEIFKLYCLEYNFVKPTLLLLVTELYEKLGEENFKSIEKMKSIDNLGAFFRINNLLVTSLLISLIVIEFVDNKCFLYVNYKDDLLNSFFEETNSFNCSAFIDNYIFERTSEFSEKLKPYFFTEISNKNDGTNIQFMLNILDNIKYTIKLLSQKNEIFDNAKKVKPTDFTDPVYELLFNSNLIWLDGEIYNPTKIIDVDFSKLPVELKPYFENESYISCISRKTTPNKLMTSYGADIKSEWLIVVNQTIEELKEIYALNVSGKHILKDEVLNNIEMMIKYYDKIILGN